MKHRAEVLTFGIWLFSAPTLAQDSPWERHTIDTSISGADGVRLADVNADGLMDITTGWEEGGYTKVYLHPGFERSQQTWPSVVVGRTPDVEDAVFVDLDADGAIDVVSSTEGQDKKVYISWAPAYSDYLEAAKWRTQMLPASDGLMQWMYAIPAQIDGQHGVDLIVGAKNEGAAIGWFRAPPDARNLSAWQWFPISPATWVMSLELRDMDADGDLDVVTSDRKPGPTQGIRWLENPGASGDQKKMWDSHFIGGRGLEVMFIDLSDLDGDGLEDVIGTATNQQIIFLKRLDVSGLHWRSHPIGIPTETGRAKAVKVGDMNGDGALDLVHTSNTLMENGKSGVMWLSYVNKPTDPDWEWRDISGDVGFKFDRIELLDIDGDGDLDVLTCEENYGLESKGLGVIWYENPHR